MLQKTELIQMIASRPETELREILCHWLDCPEKTATTPAPETSTPTPSASTPCLIPASTPTITIDGTTQNDGFYFAVPLMSGSDDQSVLMHLDTGAFEMLLTADVADALHLPHGTPLDVAGVTGDSPAYYSTVTLNFAGHVVADVQCVVDPSYTGTPLFGFRFLQDHGWWVLLQPDQQQVVFLLPVTKE